MPLLSANSSAAARLRDATAASWFFADRCRPGMTSELMRAVDIRPHCSREAPFISDVLPISQTSVFELDNGSAIKVGNDHLVQNPLVLGVFAISREVLTVVEGADDYEVVAVRREADVWTTDVGLDALELRHKACQRVSNWSIVEVVFFPLEGHNVGERHG